MRSLVGLMALALAGGCAARAAAIPAGARELSAPSIRIAGLGVEPKAIQAGVSEARIQFEVSAPAQVTAVIVNPYGNPVRSLIADVSAPGTQALVWDGRDDAGLVAPPEAYRYVLQAETPNGERIQWDAFPGTGGEALELREVRDDAATGKVRWVMPRAGRARVRVGIQGFPHLKTLMDWTPLPAGPAEVAWDGKDASGEVSVRQHPSYIFRVAALALPDNAILVLPKEAAPVQPVAPEPPAAAQKPAFPPERYLGGTGYHAQHARGNCREARVSLAIADESSRVAEGRPVISGEVPIRVTLDPRDAGRLIDQRFEVAVFEDLNTLFEEEESTNPFTFIWDTGTLTPGPHLLTVNVLSYDDHFGVATLPVTVEKRQ